MSKGRPEIRRIALPTPPTQDEWVSVREAARRADLCHVTVWAWAKRKIIPSKRKARTLLVPAFRVAQLGDIYKQYGRTGKWIFRSDDPHHAYIPVTKA